jgi:hypothetical protein
MDTILNQISKKTKKTEIHKEVNIWVDVLMECLVKVED